MTTDPRSENALWWRQCDWLLFFPTSFLSVISFVNSGNPQDLHYEHLIQQWRLDIKHKESIGIEQEKKKQRKRTNRSK